MKELRQAISELEGKAKEHPEILERLYQLREDLNEPDYSFTDVDQTLQVISQRIECLIKK